MWAPLPSYLTVGTRQEPRGSGADDGNRKADVLPVGTQMRYVYNSRRPNQGRLPADFGPVPAACHRRSRLFGP